MNFKRTIEFIRDIYQTKDFIPLHEPRFTGNEKKYVEQCIDSTFVSSVGEFVGQFEDAVADFTGAAFGIATVNGTAALHTALHLVSAGPGDEIITQALTFVATCNAISYTGARPVFVDVERESMSLCPKKLKDFLATHAEVTQKGCINKNTRSQIKAVVIMHTFGMPGKVKEILDICNQYKLKLIEDAAESLGSYNGAEHTGTEGYLGVLSFNGNKVITTGGGGMILTQSEEIARKAKHLTTTAKVPHKWEYNHDSLGFNYRLPNLNAAMGLAQMENLPLFLEKKRQLAHTYRDFFSGEAATFMEEPKGSRANYWLNTLLMEDRRQRDQFLELTNQQGIMTRPAWTLMSELPMYRDMQHGELGVSRWLEDRIVNIPSSVIL
ncbi:LegC family aminotransferase [Robiginitalea sp. IMCC43444]|uniref:LegC family aminotransferase n=1 Tax=Robiginitalea sp. IMCC43444 TaxID=3459121 RepID=UPI004041D5A5